MDYIRPKVLKGFFFVPVFSGKAPKNPKSGRPYTTFLLSVILNIPQYCIGPAEASIHGGPQPTQYLLPIVGKTKV